jgi:hypothetical protein
MEHFYTASLLFERHPPPPPQSPYFLEDNVPDILIFMGFTVYGVSLFFAMTDALEHGFADSDIPAFLIVGLMIGLLSYGLAFLSHITVGSSGHSIFTTLVFAMFAKHLTRRAEMSSRKASTVITLGILPLISLAVLEAGKVQVRSAKFFFALMMVFSAMPLGPLFREWLPGSGGAAEPVHGKLRKRIFCLFFFAFLFVAASTPTSVPMAEAQVSEARQSIVVFFDLIMIYYALDGLWMGSH